MAFLVMTDICFTNSRYHEKLCRGVKRSEQSSVFSSVISRGYVGRDEVLNEVGYLQVSLSAQLDCHHATRATYFIGYSGFFSSDGGNVLGYCSFSAANILNDVIDHGRKVVLVNSWFPDL